jgi:hypothetical protein
MVMLARMLVPDYFGLIALAVGKIADVEMLGTFKFSRAQVRERDLNRPRSGTA